MGLEHTTYQRYINEPKKSLSQPGRTMDRSQYSRKLTARIHTLDYKIDLDKKTIKIAVLHDKWVELKLKWYRYLDKYPDGSWKPGEIIVSYKTWGNTAYI